MPLDIIRLTTRALQLPAELDQPSLTIRCQRGGFDVLPMLRRVRRRNVKSKAALESYMVAGVPLVPTFVSWGLQGETNVGTGTPAKAAQLQPAMTEHPQSPAPFVVLRDAAPADHPLKGAVVAIGNFDGV